MYHQQRKRQDHKTNIDEYYFQVQKKTGWPHCSAALAPKTLLWPWLLLPSQCRSGTITRSPDQSRVGLTRRWPRDCAGPTAPRPVLGPWVALGRALATSLKPCLPQFWLWPKACVTIYDSILTVATIDTRLKKKKTYYFGNFLFTKMLLSINF